MEKLKEEHEKLKISKAKIQLKEKLLKEKERKQRTIQFSEIGRLAYKANIDQIESTALLGAFLEIAQHAKNLEKIEVWKKSSISFLKKQESEERSPLTISFKKEPSTEIKEMLKKLNFKWPSPIMPIIHKIPIPRGK